MMMHHDQSKMISNEFIYHSDGRYVDDGMMDEFMIPGGESFNELNHLENPFNKASIIASSSSMPLMNEDYFNNNNNNNSGNGVVIGGGGNTNSSSSSSQISYNNHHQHSHGNSNSSIHHHHHHQLTNNNNIGHHQYNFHTLQPAPSSSSASASSHNHHSQIIPPHHHSSSPSSSSSQHSYHSSAASSNPPYLTTLSSPNGQHAHSYAPKLAQRTTSFNPSTLTIGTTNTSSSSSSLASSPSSSSSSSTSSPTSSSSPPAYNGIVTTAAAAAAAMAVAAAAAASSSSSSASSTSSSRPHHAPAPLNLNEFDAMTTQPSVLPPPTQHHIYSPPHHHMHHAMMTSVSPSSATTTAAAAATLTTPTTPNSAISTSSSSSSSSTMTTTSGTASSSSGLASPDIVTDPAELVRLKQARNIKLTPEELQLLVKDRQRKDNHNMIERRRRFNINDRIKDLHDLLPKNGEFDTKQNKGSILKASVEYIIYAQNELKEMEKLREYNKRLLQKLKDYDMIFRANNIVPSMSDYCADEFNVVDQSSKMSSSLLSSKLETGNNATTATLAETAASNFTMMPTGTNSNMAYMNGNSLVVVTPSAPNTTTTCSSLNRSQSYEPAATVVAPTSNVAAKTTSAGNNTTPRKYNKNKKRLSLNESKDDASSLSGSNDGKRLKQEPVSPTTMQTQSLTTSQGQALLVIDPSISTVANMSGPTKLSKICSIIPTQPQPQQATKYVIAKLGNNGNGGALATTTQTCRLKNLEFPTTGSTAAAAGAGAIKETIESAASNQQSSLTRLMSTTSKDPTLASSSVGSPISPSSSSSSSSSSTSSSPSSENATTAAAPASTSNIVDGVKTS